MSTWLTGIEKEQAALPAHKAPVVTRKVVDKKISEMKTALNRLHRRPKPTPTPAPKNDTAAGNATFSKNGTNATDEGTQGEPAEASTGGEASPAEGEGAAEEGGAEEPPEEDEL